MGSYSPFFPAVKIACIERDRLSVFDHKRSDRAKTAATEGIQSTVLNDRQAKVSNNASIQQTVVIKSYTNVCNTKKISAQGSAFTNCRSETYFPS